MHLNAKQIFLLLTPFLISFIIYFFDTNITNNIQYLFPAYEEYRNKILDEKADIYLKIAAKDKHFPTILEKLKERNENAEWIAKNVLYKHTSIIKSSQKQVQRGRTYKYKKSANFILQAIFYDKNVAIINGKILKQYSFIKGAQILRIEKNRVLLLNNKGTKWVYLFR